MNSYVKNLGWAARALRPESVSIKPKKLGVKLGDSTPTNWFDDNPFLTQFFTAFSATFPLGEQFMIDTVRIFRGAVKDNDRLYKECAGFIGQEAHHSNEHEMMNEFMVERGMPVDKLETFIEWWLPIFQGLPEKDQMAITGAAEHLTAMFGDLVLRNPEIMERVHPTVRPIWIWHAIEEVEHKAVTFDLFEAVDGDYVRRIYGYVLALALVGGFSVYGTLLFMWNDRQNFNIRHTFNGLNLMFGFGKEKGYLRKIVPQFFEYFKEDYHPWYHDNSELIAEWRGQLDSMTLAA